MPGRPGSDRDRYVPGEWDHESFDLGPVHIDQSLFYVDHFMFIEQLVDHVEYAWEQQWFIVHFPFSVIQRGPFACDCSHGLFP